MIRILNGYQPVDGVLNLPIVTSVGSQEGLRMWTGVAETSTGEWKIDYSDANFKEVVNIQLTCENLTTMQAERVMSACITQKDLNSASGYVYTITSTGVLLAMQSILNSQPVKIHAVVYGKV